MEQVVRRENMVLAYWRVVRNGGAAGVDGMSVDDLEPHCQEHWPQIRNALLEDRYEPDPVRRVEIDKPDGKGTRLLGIPTVMDRMIQQAVLQVLTPIFDPTFSERSFGFRPGRSAHDALAQVQADMAEGYRWVVDMDLEKFFDRVNHDVLMARVAQAGEGQEGPASDSAAICEAGDDGGRAWCRPVHGGNAARRSSVAAC